MHSSGNLHHSKDVSTMWTDANKYDHMRFMRMCDVDDFDLLSWTIAKRKKPPKHRKLLHEKTLQGNY